MELLHMLMGSTPQLNKAHVHLFLQPYSANCGTELMTALLDGIFWGILLQSIRSVRMMPVWPLMFTEWTKME